MRPLAAGNEMRCLSPPPMTGSAAMRQEELQGHPPIRPEGQGESAHRPHHTAMPARVTA